MEKRTIEKIPPPQKTVVTRFDIHIYVCPGCGCKVTAQHRDCAKVDGLGIRLMAMITLIRFQLRGVLRRIQQYLGSHWGFDLSATGIRDILLRVGKAFRGSYESLLWKIRTARFVYVDETGIRVLGKNYWLWVFRTDADDVLVC